MSLATLFLISNPNIFQNMIAWLVGVLIVLSVFLINRRRIQSMEHDGTE